jgi:DNA-binding MarR family transcriptional regulator
VAVSEKSKLEAELNFLAALERGEVVTQMTLSKRIAVSVGLINALLKRAVRKGYVKASAAPYKRYAYYLTPKGFSEKSRLVAEYLEVSLNFFREARGEYVELFNWASARGVRRIALAGRGELAEIALAAVREADIEVIAVLDPNSNEPRFHGLAVVRSFEDLPAVDAIAVTDVRAPQQMFVWLSGHLPEPQILAPAFLHISRSPLIFKPKVSGR